MKKPVQVYISSVLKACRSRFIADRDGGNMSSSPLLTRTPATKIPKPTSYGNPCLDLYFHIRLENPRYKGNKPSPRYSDEYLKHLLPPAWSHNPSTTLKLIFNLYDYDGGNDLEGFYTAVYWLYQNHPNTLASNLAQFVGSFGIYTDLLEILYRALQGEDVRTANQKWTHYRLYSEMSKHIGGRISSKRRRDKIFSMANKALQRYHLDPNYRVLHDAVSDIYANCLKYDIQSLNNFRCNEHDESKWLEVTCAVPWFPALDSYYDRATLLSESIARKVFPPDENEKEVAGYAYRVRGQLRDEVLVPLRKVYQISKGFINPNKWGYCCPGFKQKACPVKMYLGEVKDGGKSKIKADALLPSEIIKYVNDGDLGQAAEIQWKEMEDMYLTQGRLRSCLVVQEGLTGSPIASDGGAALALLASELSEEPWKGKIVSFFRSTKPKMHSIQEGGDDLKSKLEFLRSFKDLEECANEYNDLEKVFDLILKVATNENLRPEQMVKKVFVFTDYHDFYCDSFKRCWVSDYEAIERKFKEKGYGDVVPKIVFWKLKFDRPKIVHLGGRAMMLGGFSNHLFKTFLDNEGDIGPEHVMESAISGEKYENLVVDD